MTKLHELALDQQLDPVWISRGSEELLFLNAAARVLFGVEVKENIKKPVDLFDLVPCRDELQSCLSRILVSGYEREGLVVRRGEREIIGTLSGTRVQVPGDQPAVIMSFRDESAFVRLQQRFTQEEFFDHTTGLLNRKVLDIMLSLELEKASRKPEEASIAVLMIQIRNLEQYRAVATSEMLDIVYGHIGKSVRHALRSNDLVFRFDDARIIGIVTQFEWKSDLFIIAERLEDQIAVPFHAGETDIHLQSCIGISVFPEDGDEAPQLIANAVAALNHAVEEGLPWLMYNASINQLAVERLGIRSGLTKAIKENELALFYMPIVDKQGQVAGLEGLVRWNHPTRGLLGPDSFVPVAVHSKIIGAISRWVMYRVQDDYAKLFANREVFISINLSARDFADAYLSESLDSATRDRMDPRRVKIEITESECMENRDQSVKVMRELRDRGYEVMIDDFGIGQTSIAWLKELPASIVKIDQLFLRGIVESELERDFLFQLIRLCKVRNLTVVLEGIETQAQFDLVQNSGADLFQGFLFGEPQPPAQLSAQLW